MSSATAPPPRSARPHILHVALAALLTILGTVALDAHRTTATAAPNSLGRFVPVPAARAIDTRTTGGPPAGELTITLPGLPTGAIAAAVTITAIGYEHESYITVWPTGQPRPTTSISNPHPGAIATNSTIVPLGPGNQITLYDGPYGGQADIVVDVTGAFVPAATSLDGRVTPLPTATRALDTRTTGTPLPEAGTTTAPLAGIIPDNATGAIISLTITDAPVGYFTAWATSNRTATSTVNSDGPTTGAKASGAIFLPIDTNRTVNIYAQNGGHVIVDVLGYIAPAPNSQAGGLLDLSTVGRRALDARAWYAPGDSRYPIDLLPQYSLLNLTVAGGQPGYARVWAAGYTEPDTSTVNVPTSGATTAQSTLVALNANGSGLVHSQAGGWPIIDYIASFTTGTNPPAPVTTPPATVPTARATGTFTIPTIGINTGVYGTDDAGLDAEDIINTGRASVFINRRSGGAIFFAHRASHGGPFLPLGNAAVGQTVTYTSAAGITSTWRIEDVRMVRANQIDAAANTVANQGKIAIVACTCPNWTAGCVSHRILAIAS